MPSTVKITDRKEISEFVRTHLGHRLTAMVSPLCIPHAFWCGRNDAYRAAKEGSYGMLRMLIEFLGVKSERGSIPPTLKAADGEPDNILIDAFSSFGTRKLCPMDFGTDQTLVAEAHRALCKINAHFTYNQAATDLYDRIASPDDAAVWSRAVDTVVQKLDEHFYSRVGLDIAVHFDLEKPFTEHYKTRLGLRSKVKGDGLERSDRP